MIALKCSGCRWAKGRYCECPSVATRMGKRLGRFIKQVPITDGTAPCEGPGKINGVGFKEWLRQKRTATESWHNHRDAYLVRSGKADEYHRKNLEYLKILDERSKAIEHDRGRLKKIGDMQIIQEAERRCVPYGHDKGAFELTRCQKDILVAVVRLCSGTGALFASQHTLARLAGCSRGTVAAFLAMLEAAYVLIRKESGGRNMETGECSANCYRIAYDVLRDLLGIAPCKHDPSLYYWYAKTVGKAYWSKGGYTRYSNSERSKRRKRQQAAVKAFEAVKNASSSILEYCCKQEFCTVTTKDIKEQMSILLKTPNTPSALPLNHLKYVSNDGKTTTKKASTAPANNWLIILIERFLEILNNRV